MDPSITAAAWPPGAESHGSGLPGGEIDPKLDLAARSRMASLRASMFGASAEPARVGRFVVLETLGAGGMGVVHAAYDPRLDRKIALKLVKPEVAAAGTNGEARLLREAQAMARLSHPNVVQIHEVGAWEGRVFIAMELVAGRSLATWLEVQPRGWREVVHMFAEAGRGLAAAHAAGMVHRDFKPENVLVGDDGRVRVTDFGLARGGVSESGAGETWREPGDPLAAIVEGMSVGTAAFAGTPRFMSPEQFLGEPATAASDQFSFCVALYVALHGVHPFVGEDRATLAKAVIAGERREPPRMRVPRKIHKAVVKGLARAPGARFAGMGELLRAIEPRAGWQRVMPVALFAVTGAGAASLSGQDDPCEDTSALLAGIWDAELRAATQQAFLRSEITDASLLWTTTSREFDNYALKASEIFRNSCTLESRGESSSRLHDLRVLCVRRRMGGVRSLVGVLLSGDLTALRASPEAAIGLDSFAMCEDEQTLLRGVASPPAGQEAVLMRIQDQIAQARALELLGDMAGSRVEIGEALSAARMVGHGPTLAEVLYQRARLDVYEKNFTAAEVGLNEAELLALGSRHDGLMGQIWGALIQAVVFGRGDMRTADKLLTQTEAWLRRDRVSRVAAAELERARGVTEHARGDYLGAEAATRRALELSRGELGEDHLQVVIDRLNHAHGLDAIGHGEEAISEYREVLIALRSKLGEEHMLMADVRYNLGVALLKRVDSAQREEAKEHLHQAHQIVEKLQGVYALELAESAIAQARLAQLRGDTAEAERQVIAALRIYTHHSDHPARAAAYGLHGAILYQQGRLTDALAAHQQALTLGLVARATDIVGAAESNIGDVLRERGDLGGAIRRYEAAIIAMERAFGPDAPELLMPLLGIGDARLAQGAGCEALIAYDQALIRMSPGVNSAEEIQDVEATRASARERCESSSRAGGPSSQGASG